MNIYRLALLLFVFALTTGMDDTGCQSEASGNVTQSRIHTSYWLYYDADRDTTSGRAQFRLGNPLGTTLLLSDGASVSFEGRNMGFNEALDWHEATVGGFVPGTFEYMDVDGSTFTNVAELPTGTEVPQNFPAVIRRDGSSVEVFWDGPPLGPGESMAAVVANDNNRLDFERWEVRNQGATSIVLTANQLARLAPGGAVINLRRWFETDPPQTADAGGVLRTTYQSNTVTFEIQ
ncbi:MAG: hypothetical protein AAGF12_31055 [Myxococcota bacterium]